MGVFSFIESELMENAVGLSAELGDMLCDKPEHQKLQEMERAKLEQRRQQEARGGVGKQFANQLVFGYKQVHQQALRQFPSNRYMNPEMQAGPRGVSYERGGYDGLEF